MRPLWNKDPSPWDMYSDIVIVVLALMLLAIPWVYEWILK